MKYQPTFTRDQIKRIANILDNAGQVMLASIVIPEVLGFFDKPQSRLITLVGVSITLLCWWISLRLERLSS